MDTRQTNNPDRGEEARQALIAAAIESFGKHGFDAVSTRSIAHAAGINQAMISYYFGGKEGLYLSAVEHIADSLSERLAAVSEGVMAERRRLDRSGEASPAEYLQLIYRITDRMVEVMTAEETRAWSRIIIREQQDPSPAFEVLYERFMGRIVAPTAQLLAAASGNKQAGKRERLRVITILGQVLVFRVSNAAVLRLMGWRRLGRREIRQIQKLIRANVEAIAGEGQ